MDLDLFVQVAARGLLTWTEFERMDPALIRGILERHNVLAIEIQKKREVEEKSNQDEIDQARNQAREQAEKLERLNAFGRQFERKS